MEIQLFTGFRFSPNDMEIVNHYLKRKVLGLPLCADFMVDVDDLAWRDPCTLPGGDKHRYFFSKKIRNVVTMSRYWTPMGQEMGILDPVSNDVVGIRQTLALVHTDGKMPLPFNQPKSFWFMHEYRFTEMHGTGEQEWAAYHVFHKEIKTYDGINLQLHSETDESEGSDDEESNYGENDEEENIGDMPDFIDHIDQDEEGSGFGPPPPDSP
ncbi:PREDICTED: NAC domain-containing protein 83-like [Tarenaya hassleriana]|uniref:NAC domain-containing protein 83-like n=1 Tax=Tarenaya hassleriana TaxID=28532 RepID=UPI00053C5B18|nr:PREDICTED: NAC domain-containing protein 83-like [Tarenaya hassleriana]